MFQLLIRPRWTRGLVAAVLTGIITAALAVVVTAPATASAATIGPCTADSVTMAEQAAAGVPVIVNVTSTCPSGASPLYSYFVSKSGGAWQLRAAWVGASWTLSTAGMSSGSYQVLAWVSDGPSFGAPQAQSAAMFTIGPQAACSGASSTTNAASGLAGANATITVTPDCPGAAQYAYFSGPVGGSNTLREGWTADPSFTYNTSGWPSGSYNLTVWVTDRASSAPDVATTSTYQVVPTPSCTAVGVSADPAITTPGPSVTLTASGSCNGAAANYAFFKGPTANGPWTLVQAWAGADYTFPTARLAAGNYYFVVWATDLASLQPQVQTVFEYTISPVAACSVATGSVTANADPGVPATLTATATCGGVPEYAYFSGPVGGPNTLNQGWTTSNTYAFNTSNWAPGNYNLYAWVTDGALTVPQVQAVVSYTVTTPPACTGGTADTNIAAGIVGDPVTLNIVAECPSSPVYYVYWAGKVGGGWTLEQAWTTDSSFIYDTEGWAAGSYNLMAWVSTEDGTPQVQVEDSSFTIASGGEFAVSNVTYHYQIYTEDCEEASLQMALSHEGITVAQGGGAAPDYNEAGTILGVEGVEYPPNGVGGSTGDPYRYFVGDPDPAPGTPLGGLEPGTYYPVIARAATALGGDVLAAGQGISPQEVYTDAEENHPVVVWVTFDFTHQVAHNITVAGNTFPYAGTDGHVVLVVGIGANSVLIDNPWGPPWGAYNGRYEGQNAWVPMSVFEASYSSYGDMAVVLS